MSPAETAVILRQFNEWRRGDEDIPQPDPRVIGEAIDAAVEMIDRLEAAEKSDAESIAMYRKARDERDALRAKIKQMEKQEPVAWMHETRRDSDVVTDAVKHVWGKVAVGSMAAYSIPLYTLPGAKTQGEEK